MPNECLEKGNNCDKFSSGSGLTPSPSWVTQKKPSFRHRSKKMTDAFRFLWFNGSSLQYVEDELQEWRMTRVPFGATCSPFLLTATILRHLKNTVVEKAETAKLLSESFYVDDLVPYAAPEEEVTKVCIEVEEIMETAGMTLRK
ncbi:hypothetical protein HPB48_005451 [Haemaphysalis longicornis]|uniref:Reverse transcriptase domain-containing protein n=1 Tax=Haemaphysalis longicornis TaxID=44386 RepID=A0A9J6G955_HAELO|nr:hypothetical protein HPB48_005451 [Haemaphysalis longicornis]